MSSGPPRGPKIITKLYDVRNVDADEAYCEQCQEKVPLQCPNDETHKIYNRQQKGVDVGIATLALIHKEKYETLILSSGDVDLLDMIEHLSESGKKIELVVFSVGVSTEIQSRADNIMWINDFSEEVKKV